MWLRSIVVALVVLVPFALPADEGTQSMDAEVADSQYLDAEYADTQYEDAEESEPNTLLQWNSPLEPEGGPPGWDDPLASDRPDFTEASSTVGRGVRQLEIGYTYSWDDGVSHLTAHSFPEILLRYGVLAEWLELRVGWNFSSALEVFDPLTRATTSSPEDLYLGVKLGLTPQQGFWPEMAIVPQMTVPIGGATSAGRVLPGLNWLYGWDLNDFMSMAGSTQVNIGVDEDTDDKFTEFAQSWTIGYTLSERLGAYTEWFAIVPAGAESVRTEHYLDGGFTYRWSNDLQFDIRAGKGVSSAATDVFSGVGMVLRW